MVVIPAIDLKDGQCVRLFQGRRDAVTAYSNDPGAVAREWESCGAELIHIVDLDGAFTGSQKNLDAIIRIRKSITAKLQVGGGIRSSGDVMRLFALGINRIVIGTAAIEDEAFVTQSCTRYPEKVLIGIDAKEGKVAIRGWEQVTSIGAIELAKRLERTGAAGIVYTDILRDGTMTGPNIEAIRKIVEAVEIPVIAAGGVSRIEDIKNLMEIEGLWGVITGKALYSGTLDLREAIQLVRGKS